MVEGYALHDVLGGGTHAEVHRAEAVGRPGRIVAVKRFRAAPTPAAVRQVRREAEALERLSHPGIVRLLEVAPDGDGVALVTPFVPGGTLAARIARGPLSAALVADLGARLGDALAAAHAAGVVHGGVTPANVLYDAEEQPLLADFGAATLAGRRTLADEQPEGTGGTPTYLDPAVARGEVEAGPASDQYALGVVLYEALAGAPPYAAPTVDATLRAAERGVHIPLAELAPDAPTAVVTAIERAIGRTPADRFPTVRELASHLEEARASLPTDAPAPPAPFRSPDVAGSAPELVAGSAPELATGSAPEPSPPPAAPPLPTHRGGGTADRPTSARRRVDDPNAARRSGPAPPRSAFAPPRARRRTPLLLAALVVALVPGGVVLALVLGDDEPEITAPPGDTEEAPADAAPVPRCDGAPALPPDAGDPVPADTTGAGCTVDLGWDADGPVLAVPQEDGDLVRYQLGEPGDVLLVGDWDCDGRQTPGLYRPVSGEVFLFDGFAGPGGELESRPAEATGVSGGTPVVTTDPDGCDRIEVREDA